MKSSINERTQGWISVQFLELVDAMIAHIAYFGNDPAGEGVLQADVPLLGVGVAKVGGHLRLVSESRIPRRRQRLQEGDYLGSEKSSSRQAGGRPAYDRPNVAKFTEGADVATFKNRL